MVVPVSDQTDTYTLLGVLLAMRHLIPHLVTLEVHHSALKGSFGQKSKNTEVKIDTKQLIQVCVWASFVFVYFVNILQIRNNLELFTLSKVKKKKIIL